MKIAEYLNQLASKGIYLTLENQSLKCRAQKGALTNEVKQQLKEYKTHIIEFLSIEDTSVEHNQFEILPQEKHAEKTISYGQQRLWFIDKFEQGSTQFNMPEIFTLKGQLDKQAFSRALTTIVERHQVLRTHFLQQDEQLTPVIKPVPEDWVHFHDISHLQGDEQHQTLLRLLTLDIEAPFDLTQDYMLRVQLFILSPQQHVINLNMHHIASDGWSKSIMVQEFVALYSAYTLQQENPLPPLPLQYTDYAHWQKQWLEQDQLQQEKHYWQHTLENLPVLHGLPIDFPRPPKQVFHGSNHITQIDASLTQQLNTLCQQQQVTLFILLQTAFSVLLHRYSGDTDIVMGSPVAGRHQQNIESLIGFFVNTLILRTQVEGEESFHTLLQRNKEAVLSALTHQHLPFDVLVDMLKPTRSLSHSPLFQILFVLQNNEKGQLTLPNLTLEAVDLSDSEQAEINLQIKYDLELYITEEKGQLTLEWKYAHALFSDHTIDTMASAFHCLLEAIAHDIHTSNRHINCIPETQQHWLLTRHNPAPSALGHYTAIHQLFTEQATRTPHNIAVTQETSHLTYNELEQQANRLAHHLIQQGYGHGDIIALHLPRGLHFVVAMLAVWKTGAAYLAIDPTLPLARIQFLLQDSQARLLFSQLPLSINIETCQQQQIDAPLLAHLSTLSDIAPSFTGELTAPAVVVYTSGSTGLPKGVILPHQSLINRLRWLADCYPYTASEVCPWKTALSFVDHIAEICQPLCCGATLVTFTPEQVFDIDTFIHKLAQENITRLNAVPSLLQLLADHPEVSSLTQLRHIFSSGESLSAPLAQHLCHILPHTTLVNIYGSSETGADVTYFQYQAAMPSLPIGHPLPNVQLYVLNGETLTPRGGVGELVVGGLSLASGYLGQAQDNDERFIPSPFGPETLFRTGDRVRWLPSGELAYLGRQDKQLKINGIRIEPEEIRNGLLKQPHISDALITLVETQAGPLLVAYTVTDKTINEHDLNERDALTEQLRQGLRQHLPDYMLPRVFEFISAIPLTPSGKPDHQALPEPVIHSSEEYVPPSSELEILLCTLFQQQLNQVKVGIHDNIFDLGIDSIKSMQMTSQIKKQGLTCHVRMMFSHQTVAELAKAIELKTQQKTETVTNNQEKLKKRGMVI